MNRLRIVRARRDSPRIVATLAGTFISLIVGYQAGATIFRPAAAATETNPDSDPSGANTPAPPQPASVVDAGRNRPALPSAAAATVTAHINGGLLSGCGDGEEISIGSASCDTPAGAEAALRAHLGVVATCPSAPNAARDPSKVLSMGLTVDFERHRVAVLLGRSSSVPDKVSYVACVREGMSGLEDLWALQHAHRRYLWYFNVHFSPSTGAALPQAAPVAPEVPVEPPATPTPVAPPTPPVAVAPAETPDGGVHTVAIPLDELVRHAVTGHSTVTWSTAIVRSSPRDGEIVGRLPQGTEVELLERRGGWWAIRWDGNHTPHAGWAWHLAIGQ